VNLPLIDAIAASSISLIPRGDWNHQNLSNTAWSVATLAVYHAPLMHAIASASLRSIGEFNMQAVATMAWSFDVIDGHLLLQQFLDCSLVPHKINTDNSGCVSWAEYGNLIGNASDSNKVGRFKKEFDEQVLRPLLTRLEAISAMSTASYG